MRRPALVSVCGRMRACGFAVRWVQDRGAAVVRHALGDVAVGHHVIDEDVGAAGRGGDLRNDQVVGVDRAVVAVDLGGCQRLVELVEEGVDVAAAVADDVEAVAVTAMTWPPVRRF